MAKHFIARNRKEHLDATFIFQHCRRMKTPAEILDYIGNETVRAALGVGADRVRLARTAPQLPASWYDTLEHLAGRPLDRAVFSFKRDARLATASPAPTNVQRQPHEKVGGE